MILKIPSVSFSITVTVREIHELGQKLLTHHTESVTLHYYYYYYYYYLILKLNRGVSSLVADRHVTLHKPQIVLNRTTMLLKVTECISCT